MGLEFRAETFNGRLDDRPCNAAVHHYMRGCRPGHPSRIRCPHRKVSAMKGLRDTLASLSSLRTRFERLLSSAAKRAGAGTSVAAGRLHEVTGFGSNPGNLRMLTHVPGKLPKAPALVVALHGCTQTGAVYDHGSGWSTLADADGFVVLFPEQQRANNPNNCFNWFSQTDVRRDHGEVLSIRQMIERTIIDHGIDRHRVFVVGLSAGGAMVAAMLATYPDVFAGGAIIAGLPYGSAINVQQAFEAMARGKDQSAREWGDLVRSASPHKAPWPKLSIWHGTHDAIVNPKNMEDSLQQWIDVHGVSVRPRIEHDVEGHSRRLWRTEADDDVIEAITVKGMPHGVPISTSGAERCGTVSPFHFDVGISSTHHIARFWGLADKEAVRAKPSARERIPEPIMQAQVAATPLLAARVLPDADVSGDHGSKSGEPFSEGPRSPQDIIAAALKAAGLLNEGEAREQPSNPFDPRRIITSTLRSVGVLKN
jgi:poly(hydroxyalkanoate) depolymerase family esterase